MVCLKLGLCNLLRECEIPPSPTHNQRWGSLTKIQPSVPLFTSPAGCPHALCPIPPILSPKAQSWVSCTNVSPVHWEQIWLTAQRLGLWKCVCVFVSIDIIKKVFYDIWHNKNIIVKSKKKRNPRSWPQIHLFILFFLLWTWGFQQVKLAFIDSPRDVITAFKVCSWSLC